MLTAKPTILYVPPADRPDVLAPSVGGVIPPMWGRMNRYQPPDYDIPVPDPWGSLVGCPDWPKFSERALLLREKHAGGRCPTRWVLQQVARKRGHAVAHADR
jgi:hypothetical protein